VISIDTFKTKNNCSLVILFHVILIYQNSNNNSRTYNLVFSLKRKKVPERKRIVMITNVGDKIIRKLCSRIELSKITKNRSPSKFLRRRRRLRRIVKVECVFERCDSIRKITTKFVKLVLVYENGRVFGRKRKRRRRSSF